MNYLFLAPVVLLSFAACSSDEDDGAPSSSSSSSTSSSSGDASSSSSSSSSGGSSGSASSSSSSSGNASSSSSSSSGSSSGSVPTTTIDCTGTVIAQYAYGNQINHSYVTFMLDGSIVHEERVTADVTAVPETPLTSTQVSQMRAQITAASDGPFSEVAGQPTSFGSEAGTFEACVSGAATGFVIRQVLRAEVPDGTNADTIVVNGSPAAAPLLQTVHGYSTRDMPLP